jgi:hypothetical protein
VLGKLRRVPSAAEAVAVLDQIASEGRLAAAGRALLDRLEGVPKRPTPFVDAVLSWVVTESAAVSAAAKPPAIQLRVAAGDVLLLVAAVLPVAALAA